jgi:hypothetical protein
VTDTTGTGSHIGCGPRRARWATLLFLALAACRPDPATPRGAAERFLDAYFGLDRAGALAASASRAHELVEEEIRLTAGQPVDAETHVPAVRYRLLRQEPSGAEAVHLVYAVRIVDPETAPVEQRWLVMVGRVQEHEWRVVNFERLPE